jgi:dipeptidyl aminopeptidase/acylaminoacyl peptidase
MRRVVLVLATVVLVPVVAVLIAVAYLMSRAPAAAELDDPHDVTIDIPRGNLYGGPSFGRQLDISPDGKRIVYVGQAGKGSRTLFVHTIGEKEPARIPGIDAGNRDVRDPTFSPDGRYVAYWARGSVKKIALDGTISVAHEAPSTRGIGWLDSDTLVLGNPEGPLMKLRLSASEEQAVPLMESKGPVPHVSPQVLPGNKAILFTIAHGALTSAHIWILNLETGEQHQLLDENAYAPRYLPGGRIVFGRGPNRELMAVRFELSTLRIVDSAQPVLSLPLSGTGAGGATDYAVSATGVLVYTPYLEAGSDTLRGWFGDPTKIHVRLNWFEELERPSR